MARLLERELVNRRGIDLSKEALLVSVGQRALELPVVKVGGQKKVCRLAQFEPDARSEAEQQNFFENW